MMKFKNLLFTILLVFLFVEVVIVFPNHLAKNNNEPPPAPKVVVDPNAPPKKEEPIPLKADQKVSGMHLVESQSGKRDWELFAQSASGSQGSGSWNLKQVRALFYNSEKVEFTVTGDEGSIDSKTKNLSIRGHVVTQSANGYSFETPSIEYQSTIRQISCPEEVVMKGPHDKDGDGLHLKGSDMIVEVDKSLMHIRGHVTAEKEIKDKKKVEIQADSAEFSGKNRQARFIKNVTVNYEKMKIEGPEANFMYKPGQNILDTIQFKGGVKVADANKFASADNLNVDLLENKLTFRGKPKIIQDDDELTGDEIIFLDGGKRVKVNKVRARVESEKP
jgi:LPS export ABC transporter protein LptC